MSRDIWVEQLYFGYNDTLLLKGPPIFCSHIHKIRSSFLTTILLVQIAWELNFNMQGQYVVIFITWAMQHLYLPIFTCQNTAAYRKYMFVIKNGETTKSWKEKQLRKTMLKYSKGMYKTISNHVASYKAKTALYHFCMDCEL